MITAETLKDILPNCKDPDLWSFELSAALPEHNINTKERIALFLSQAAHESAEFNVLQENLNYSAQGLRKVFPKYFPDDHTAWRYARQPQWIASRVYGGRMGNGSEQSKEGWKYRGRGVIQLTGKNNYRACSLHVFGDDRLLDMPDIILEPEYALASALWFWDSNNLVSVTDVKRLTKLVNGGYNGLQHRLEIYNRSMEYL